MPDDRRQARILAMQALCQWDVQGDDSQQGLYEFMHAQGTSDEVTKRTAALVISYWDGRQGIDDRIESAAEKWSLGRLLPVDRNIMRVAIVEILGDEIPDKVAITEAMDIGREYGDANSPRFLNGVLDKISKRRQHRPKQED